MRAKRITTQTPNTNKFTEHKLRRKSATFAPHFQPLNSLYEIRNVYVERLTSDQRLSLLDSSGERHQKHSEAPGDPAPSTIDPVAVEIDAGTVWRGEGVLSRYALIDRGVGARRLSRKRGAHARRAPPDRNRTRTRGKPMKIPRGVCVRVGDVLCVCVLWVSGRNGAGFY